METAWRRLMFIKSLDSNDVLVDGTRVRTALPRPSPIAHVAPVALRPSTAWQVEQRGHLPATATTRANRVDKPLPHTNRRGSGHQKTTDMPGDQGRQHITQDTISGAHGSLNHYR